MKWDIRFLLMFVKSKYSTDENPDVWVTQITVRYKVLFGHVYILDQYQTVSLFHPNCKCGAYKMITNKDLMIVGVIIFVLSVMLGVFGV